MEEKATYAVQAQAALTMEPLHQTTVDEEKQRVLYEVCSYGDWVDVERMVKAGGVSLRRSDDAGLNPLHHACQGNNFRVAEKLLEQTDILHRHMLYEKTNTGETALVMACRLGHDDVVKVLVSKRASVTLGFSGSGEMPLHVACARGHVAVVRELLQHESININITDDALETPLHKACAGGHTEVIGILVDNHADVNCRNGHGCTALHTAVERNELSHILLLLHTDPDLEVRNQRGVTALHQACIQNNVKAVRALIKQGADPNMTTTDTLYTPLHIACCSGEVALAKTLVNSGAHLDVVDRLGRTPLFTASLSGYGDIVRFLLQRGASILGDNDHNPIQEARRGRHTDVVNMLIAHLRRRYQAQGICKLLIALMLWVTVLGM